MKILHGYAQNRENKIGGSPVSYQSDMETYATEMAQRKNLVGNIIKITAAVLAVALLAVTVFLVLDVLNENGTFDPAQDQSAGNSLLKPADGRTVTVKQGGTLSYKSLVEYPDGYELDWNSDNVDLDKPGKYSVTYTLSQNGNV